MAVDIFKTVLISFIWRALYKRALYKDKGKYSKSKVKYFYLNFSSLCLCAYKINTTNSVNIFFLYKQWMFCCKMCSKQRIMFFKQPNDVYWNFVRAQVVGVWINWLDENRKILINWYTCLTLNLVIHGLNKQL